MNSCLGNYQLRLHTYRAHTILAAAAGAAARMLGLVARNESKQALL